MKNYPTPHIDAKPEDFGYDLVMGFRQAAEPSGYQVELIPLTLQLQQDTHYDTYMVQNNYSGALLLGLSLLDPWMKDFETCKEYLYQIYENSGSSLSNSTAMLGYLYLFLAKLMEEGNMISPVASVTQSNYVIEAIKFIQFNYSTDISVDHIANAVGISRSHLYRVFVSNLGQSPIDYLTEYRINEACELLKNTNLSISQVAVSVGFFDQFYFSRVFKKIKKIPPSKYLQSLENQGDA